MDDMRICGSCHTLVMPQGKSVCPRCRGPLDPTREDVLETFIEEGITAANTPGGVTLKEAQLAAQSILSDLMITRARLQMHHAGEPRCSACEEDG